MVGGLLGLLDSSFPESNERRVGGIAERLRSEIGRYRRTGGAADEIATRIADRMPFVYAESGFGAVARRWATQFEENAKRLAVFDEVPEAFHNAVVGWSRIRPDEARRCAAVLIQWNADEAPLRRGWTGFDRLLSGRSVRTVRVTLPSDDRLEAVLQGVALGDQVSLRLAEQRKVDPFPVEAIDRFRATLAR
jgi:glucose/mannose-6-phosphate isomerase